jgi:Flp pilus assembly protein TadG
MLSIKLKDKRGTVTVMVALLLIMLIGFAAFAIDVGYMMVRRNELQNIADTAALAAAGQLGANYGPPMTYAEQLVYQPDAGPLLSVAQSVADGTGISGVVISGADFSLGKWNPVTHTFTPGAIQPTAVKVTARKDNVANGPVTTLLAGVLGIASFNVSATATASLTSLLTPPSGGLPLPVGISLYKFQSPYCDSPITLYPSNDINSCAGWNVYNDPRASDSEFRKIVGGLTDGTYTSPEITAGQTDFNFTGGTLGMQAFLAIQTLFNTNRVKNDGVIDKDDDPNTWTTTVPVYQSDDCSNPHGDILIVGFSTIKITHVGTPPDMTIYATILCDSITSGPGGAQSGIPPVGTIPNLVQ